MRPVVACLDVWAPAVREVVARTAPPELELRFATSYDDAEQMGLVESAEFLTEAQRRDIFWNNAVSFYKLSVQSVQA